MKINELDNVCAPEKQDRITEFCEWCCEQLGIDVPHLRMAPKNDTTALGYTDMSDGSVTIVVGDRHQMDIMRTLAHELVHVRQMGSYEPDGATGSDDENEANAMAGVLMREWGQNNPDLYTEGVNVEEGKKSAQDRFNDRLKKKHGIDLDANLAKYKEMMDRLRAIDSGAPKTKADESFGEPSADAKERAAAAQQKNIDDKYVATVDSNSKAGFYKNPNTPEGQVDESKTARMMALITALGATYGLEDEARAFADQIQQNIHNAQTAEPNPGRPDPVTPGNMKPGSDRVMRPPVDEIAPAIAGAVRGAATLGRGVVKGAGAVANTVANTVGSMAKTAGINRAIDGISGDEANEASTTSKILKGAPGAPTGKPDGVREAVNVQSIKDEVMGAVRSGNPREMKRVSDTIAKRISDLMDLRGTAGKEVDAEIITALPVLKKAQMMLRDKQKMSEEKTRIDKKCWKGKKIGNPKTKVKGGVRVNNCVPKE